MVRQLIGQSSALSKTINDLETTDYLNDTTNFKSLTDRIVMMSERFACDVREFAQRTYIANRYEVLGRASEIQGIEVVKDGNTIIIDLPFLLPRKKGKQNYFIGDPLRYKLEEFSKTQDLKIKDKSVICIIHTYNNVSKKARCYDYDNLESKKILDIVTLFTLTDDAPEYCDIYQTVKLSNIDKTRILIMPVEDFSNKKMSLMSDL